MNTIKKVTVNNIVMQFDCPMHHLSERDYVVTLIDYINESLAKDFPVSRPYLLTSCIDDADIDSELIDINNN